MLWYGCSVRHRRCLWVGGGAGQDRVPGPGVLGAGRGTVGETAEMGSGDGNCAAHQTVKRRHGATWALTSLFEPWVLDLVPLID